MKKWVKRSPFDGRIIRVLPYNDEGTSHVAKLCGMSPAEVLLELKNNDNAVKTLVSSVWHVEEL